jgi:hypothetical protein
MRLDSPENAEIRSRSVGIITIVVIFYERRCLGKIIKPIK